MVNWEEVAQIPFKSKIQLIPWCHNFINKQSEYLNVFAESDRIARVINVSREQMDLYMDHPAYDKMDYIFNCVPYPDEISDKITSMPFACRDNIVTYVGSLVPAKCFHVLATMWPDIVKRVPNAQLYVIGSGKLYDENAKLGKYNIAEETYEKKTQEVTEPVMREVERVVMLRVVDEYWMDHIDAMAELRQGVGLRAYGQADPVVVYRKEGYEMFGAMTDAIRAETVRRLFLIQLRKNEEVKRQQVAKITAAGGGDNTVKKQPVVKKIKVGRNDPCPCGSGKKYKNCCMDKDLNSQFNRGGT